MEELPTPAFPSVAKPGLIYDGDPRAYLAQRVAHRGLVATRLVLHDDGSFVLHLASPRWGLGSYAGTYTRTEAGIECLFESGTNMGGAFARVRDDILNVEFDVLTKLESGLQDAAYTFVRRAE